MVFERDEMKLHTFSEKWGPEELLQQEGLFFLKDVARVLDFDPIRYKNRIAAMIRCGENPWELMGTRKVFNHWVVRMKVFAPFYRSSIMSQIRRIEPGWNGNRLLAQEGIFLLTDVCRLIPFSAHQLRYRVRNLPGSRQECGVWRDKEWNVYLVDMVRFGPWIYDIWKGTLGTL